MKKAHSLSEVRDFWNQNPLFSGELTKPVGTAEWFSQQDELQFDDVYVKQLEPFVTESLKGRSVLEVGCGPGFLSRKLAAVGANYTGIDLTAKAIELAKAGQKFMNLPGTFKVSNAENLDFPDASFDHVVSSGVIHHTPNTQKCIDEFYRVLKPGGTGVCSVYYKNWILQNELLVRAALKSMKVFGLGLKGRGRKEMWHAKSADDLVRMYDGFDNPLGKAYTAKELLSMFSKFTVHEIKPHYFPARALKIPLPLSARRWLSRTCGLMIYVKFSKPQDHGSAH